MSLRTLTIAAICLMLSVGASAQTKKEKAGMTHATGPFDVKISPLSEDKGEGANLGRMSLDKQFHGDLEATSKGEMLTAMSEVPGSGVYVAVERVTGKLHGRSGSFALVHKGVMTRGAQQLDLSVVPDSGSGELAGISGKMAIIIAADGKHSYDFEYTLQ